MTIRFLLTPLATYRLPPGADDLRLCPHRLGPAGADHRKFGGLPGGGGPNATGQGHFGSTLAVLSWDIDITVLHGLVHQTYYWDDYC